MEGAGAVDGWLTQAIELFPVQDHVGWVAGMQRGVRGLDHGEQRLAAGPVFVEDEAAAGDGVISASAAITPNEIVYRGDDGGQVVELGGEDPCGVGSGQAAGPSGAETGDSGPVAQRRLGQQKLEGPLRIVQGLLAAQPGGHGGGMAAAVAGVGLGHDPACVLGGLHQAGDNAGLEVADHPGAGLQVADRVLDRRQAASEPDPEGCHLVDGRLGQGQQHGPAVTGDVASAQAVTSGRDSTACPRSGGDTVDWLTPAARPSSRPDSPASMRVHRS